MYTFYKKSPVWAQNLLCSIYGLKAEFYRSRNSADIKRLSLNEEELKLYQKQRLREHLIAASRSEYWLKEFQRLDINAQSDDPFDILSRLPVINKNTIQGNETLFLNSSLNQSELLKISTSGSTGAGLQFWETKAAQEERWSCWWRYRKLNGINSNDLCAVFGGQKMVPLNATQPPFFRWNRPAKQMQFSSYHLDDKSIFSYIDALNKYQPPWIHGYPSTIYSLSKLAQDNNLSLNYVPKIITLGSEGLLANQVDNIKLFFNCRLIQHYGLAESVANISQYPDDLLRIDEDFSYVELLEIEGLENTYKLVGTNWSNPAFPLIRYDTGDVVTASSRKVISGGYNGRVIEYIDGRLESIICLPSGRKIGRIAGVFKNYPGIREAQILQRKDFNIELYLVVSSGFDKAIQERVLKSLSCLFDNEITISLSLVNEIKKTKSGKIRFVISEIKY